MWDRQRPWKVEAELSILPTLFRLNLLKHKRAFRAVGGGCGIRAVLGAVRVRPAEVPQATLDLSSWVQRRETARWPCSPGGGNGPGVNAE